MSELLPLSDCPFCGSVASYREDNNSIATGGYDYWILCGECGSTSDYYATPELAAESWNRRAPVQASEARGDWVLVPRDPTEEMLEAGRSAVMARDCSGPKWGPADHYRAAGIDRTGIPDRLFEGRQKMSKAWCAELVYAAMISAHTQAGPVD